MQNRYVGDVGDFGKHGLLRYLSGMTSNDDNPWLRLGVIWYLYHDEVHNNHGDLTSFLNRRPDDDKSEYRNCDPELWEKLRDLVHRPNTRCVHCVQLAGILPQGTEYFGTPLYFMPEMSPTRRQELRGFWFEQALEASSLAELVYVDPDTGLREGGMLAADGPKYTYINDLQALWNRGQSLVIYHHLGMLAGRVEDRAREGAANIQQALGVEPITLRFKRGPARAFYVVPQPDHAER